VPNGISFVSDQTGRNTGEAYVQFSNKEMVEKALKKHLDKIGHRWGKTCGFAVGAGQLIALGTGTHLL
jgi:hypothetical protein